MHVSNFLILFWIVFNITVLLKNPYARVKFLVPYSGAVCSFFSFLLGMVNYWGWREHRYREDNQNQNPNLSHQTHLPNSNAIFIVYSKISNFSVSLSASAHIFWFLSFNGRSDDSCWCIVQISIRNISTRHSPLQHSSPFRLPCLFTCPVPQAFHDVVISFH